MNKKQKKETIEVVKEYAKSIFDRIFGTLFGVGFFVLGFICWSTSANFNDWELLAIMIGGLCQIVLGAVLMLLNTIFCKEDFR